MAIKNRNIFVRACPIAQSGVVEIKDFSFSIWTEYPSHNPFNIDLNLQEAKSVYKLLEKEIKDKENWIKKNYGDEISNAKLIAAAPELLEALELISGMSSLLLDDKYFREFTVAVCKNAIAKATNLKDESKP